MLSLTHFRPFCISRKRYKPFDFMKISVVDRDINDKKDINLKVKMKL